MTMPESTNTLKTRSLGFVGAEVLGVTSKDLLSDDFSAAMCMEALAEAGVLVFRDLAIDDETQVAFSKRLDDVGKAEPAPMPKIFVVTLDESKNPKADYLRGTFLWHIDGAQDEVPTKATMLTAKAISAVGGETEFASTYAAFEDLNDSEREEMEQLRVVHSFEASQQLVNPDPSPEEVAGWHQMPNREHPLVWEHRSGRRSLVIGATADHIVGVGRSEGRQLLHDLIKRATQPEKVYRHTWNVGDLVIWDNTGVMHRACSYEPSSARELHRTTMSGDEPIR
jgi:alpha-ketoglutarate-dependent taurine dioxygenase